MTQEQKQELINAIALSIMQDANFENLIKSNLDFLYEHASKFVKSENPELWKHVEGLMESFLSGDKGKQKQSLVWGFVDALEAILKEKPASSVKLPSDQADRQEPAK